MKFSYIDFNEQELDGPKFIDRLLCDVRFSYKLVDKILNYFPKYKYVNLNTAEARSFAFELLCFGRLHPREFVDIAAKYSFINDEQTQVIFSILDETLNRHKGYYFDYDKATWFPTRDYATEEFDAYLYDFHVYYTRD